MAVNDCPAQAGNPGQRVILLTLLAFLAGCATSGPPGAQFDDPYEDVNRQIHAFNKGVDTVVYRPASVAYGTVLPDPVRLGVSNFAQNIDTPRRAVNDALQGDVEDTVHNLFRFIINSTLGVLGVFDPATSIGLEQRDTDFGETLHVWGVGEGAYLSVPFFGPSTQRDLTGDVVDLVTNPLTFILVPPESFYGPAARVGDNANERYNFRDSLDAILYESADSYAQSRQIYLENRRFELGRDAGPSYVDPYDDLGGADGAPVDPAAEAAAGATPEQQPAAPTYVDPYDELYQ